MFNPCVGILPALSVTVKLNVPGYIPESLIIVSVEEDSQSIKERKNLSANGYLEITIMVTPKGNIHNNPIVSFKGLPIFEKEEFVYGMEDEIERTTRTFKLGSKQQEHNLIDALKIACRKFSKEKTGKKPYININIVKI